MSHVEGSFPPLWRWRAGIGSGGGGGKGAGQGRWWCGRRLACGGLAVGQTRRGTANEEKRTITYFILRDENHVLGGKRGPIFAASYRWPFQTCVPLKEAHAALQRRGEGGIKDV